MAVEVTAAELQALLATIDITSIEEDNQNTSGGKR
jgi:hypothetical protein